MKTDDEEQIEQCAKSGFSAYWPGERWEEQSDAFKARWIEVAKVIIGCHFILNANRSEQ